jgi:SpoVK/Ycf46/Vps4 family AAA+-type ATPase
VHEPGDQNSIADALSRTGTFKKKVTYLEETDEATKGKILHENHDSILGVHRDMNKIFEAIKQHFYWPNMEQEMEEYVRKCTKCHFKEVLRAKRKAPMEITITASHLFEKSSFDFVGGNK